MEYLDTPLVDPTLASHSAYTDVAALGYPLEATHEQHPQLDLSVPENTQIQEVTAEGDGETTSKRQSHNRNPVGRNQYGQPVDTDKLRILLRHYFDVECITEWKTILSRLETEHGVTIK